MRSCRPRPGHFPETVGQGGVAGLLLRRRGTGEGGEAGSTVAFDDSDDAPVIGGGSSDVLRHRGGEGSEMRPREEDEDDRSSKLTARTSRQRCFGDQWWLRCAVAARRGHGGGEGRAQSVGETSEKVLH
jgi:hypothetical protein